VGSWCGIELKSNFFFYIRSGHPVAYKRHGNVEKEVEFIFSAAKLKDAVLKAEDKADAILYIASGKWN